MPITPITPTSLAGRLLLGAFEAGQTLPLAWVEITVGPLVVTVAADAMQAPLLDRPAVRLPVTYRDTIPVCRALGCIAPTKGIADAMFAQARARLHYVGLVRTKADAARMRSVEFTLRFHDRVEAQLATRAVSPGDLVFGAWKLWILHRRLEVRGAVNYGFWDTTKSPPTPVQGVGARHDATHYDYSQLLQPVKRVARRVADGAPVDLLEVIEREEKVDAKFLAPYRT